MTPPTRCRAAVVAILAIGLLTACGDDDPDVAAPTPSVVATAEPTPTTTPTPTPETTPNPEPTRLTDGRYPAHLTAVNVTDRTITFDVIQFLTGDAATKAAQEDGEEAPPPNDYYIRNTNPALRTMPIPADATITVNTLEAETSGDATQNVPVDLERLAGYEHLADVTFWLTVKDSVITAVEEQFVP